MNERSVLLAALLLLLAAPATIAAAPSAGRTSKASPALLEKGKAAYAASCLVCHGESGKGDGPAGVALNPRPRDFTKEPFKKGEAPEQVFASISEGLPDSTMVAFGHLPEEDRWALAHYVLSLRRSGAGK